MTDGSARVAGLDVATQASPDWRDIVEYSYTGHVRNTNPPPDATDKFRAVTKQPRVHPLTRRAGLLTPVAKGADRPRETAEAWRGSRAAKTS